MFSKKITNGDTEETSKPKMDEPLVRQGGNIYNNKNSLKKEEMEAWIKAHKPFRKKILIVEILVILTGIIGVTAISIIGGLEQKKYMVNYDQANALLSLNTSAKKAIPLFAKYTSDNPPFPIKVNTVNAIVNTEKYLVMFEYINGLSDSNFTYVNFNTGVEKYRQWPQTDIDPNNLECKTHYTATIDNLVTGLQPAANTDIPTVDNKPMLEFAKTLQLLNMDVYATQQGYNDAQNLTYYSLIPLLIAVLIDLGIKVGVNNKKRKGIEQNPLKKSENGMSTSFTSDLSKDK